MYTKPQLSTLLVAADLGTRVQQSSLRSAASSVFDVCVCKPFVQEHPVGLVLAIVMLRSRVGVYIDVTVVDLVKDEAHVGVTGLCRAAVAACEGVCSVVYGREAVALCAGHCGESEGVAVSVCGCASLPSAVRTTAVEV